MWDFEIGRTVGIVVRTWPFVLLRIVVYVLITLAYILATGTGAGVGYGVGNIFPDGSAVATAFWGGIVGFGLVSVVLYWVREYILYIVKAGHIAVMVHLIEGRDVPGGQGQIAYGRRIVTERFAEASVLFAVDQLIKGVLRAITGLLSGIAAFIPGMSGIVGFINGVIRMSVTYVDEIILGYNIRTGSTAPFETARHGIVLYAQNARVMVKNAVWLTIFIWLVGAVLFLLVLAPAGAIVYGFPGASAGWTFVFAVLLAWACVSAFVEPFAIAALMEVYFRTIEGQVPDPEWDERLAEASKKFRQLKDRAAEQIRETFPRPVRNA
ncbi:MAG: hypothetical protein J0H34_07490 [Rhizobiales bacterium]|nr:hypothetical protein [Hyphomicrobiales bacterium]